MLPSRESAARVMSFTLDQGKRWDLVYLIGLAIAW